LIESAVSLFKQCKRITRSLLSGGNANCDSQHDILLLIVHFVDFHQATQFIRDRKRRLVVSVRQQHRKLLSAHAGERVVFPQVRLQALADLLQHVVTGIMAEAIIDLLKEIEIDSKN